jgi:prephenate dehydrogenase (NADP+)
VHVLPDGYAVSRSSDFIIYSVEAEYIDRVVSMYGPGESRHLATPVSDVFSPLIIIIATKVGCIVAGQTSVKTPEKESFEKYLPHDVSIVSCHSMHGPTVSPFGQPLASLFFPLSIPVH